MDETHAWFLLPEILTCELPQWCTWNARMSIAATCTRLLREIRSTIAKLPYHIALKYDDAHVSVFPGLAELDYAGQWVTDYGLTQLTSLKKLSVYTGITNIGIAPLSSLTDLTLCNTPFITGAVLRQITSLASLWLLGCEHIHDISTLTNLTRLYTGQSTINDTSLGLFTKLEHLAIGCHTDITDASISILKQLTRLDLLECRADCRISASCIGSLSNLERLAFDQARFCPALSTLARLNDLEVTYYASEGWQERDLLAIARLPRLDELDVSIGDGIVHDTTLACLSACTSLTLDQDMEYAINTNAAVLKLTRLKCLDSGHNRGIDKDTCMRRLRSLHVFI